MCGICGIVRREGVVSHHHLRAMNTALIHRGPDDEGYLECQTVGLAMRRLSIIDLHTGHQPIGNEDGSVQIVFNGEIYNYRELRAGLNAKHTFRTQSDTEEIVHAYEEYGLEFLPRLNGMFAFALYDQHRNRVLLARDRTGQKPLFYFRTPEQLVFASELKALLQMPDVSRTLNHRALYDYLSLQYVPGPETILQDVYQLPPASYGLWEDGQWQIGRWWEPAYHESRSFSEPEWIERTRETVTQAIHRHLVSDVPLGAFLSGGVDSSIVTAVMAQTGSKPKTFSIEFDVEAYSEAEHARRIAQRYQTDHHVFRVSGDEVLAALPEVVWYGDQPLADTSCLAVYHLARLTRQHVTVALSGDGGDEAFAGYIRYLLDRYVRYYRWLPRMMREQWIPGIGKLLPESSHTPTDRNWVAGLRRLAQVSATTPKASILAWGSFFTEQQKHWLATPDWLTTAAAIPTPSRLSEIYDRAQAETHLGRTLAVDFATYLPDDLLVKTDRMSMAHSLETRAPFLDNEVLALTQQMPESLKIRGNTQKWILRRAFADLLPPQNVKRIKRGFGMPVASWLRGALKKQVYDILLDPRTTGRGFFLSSRVEQLLQEHQAGQVDHGQRLWALLVLEFWMRQYIDGERA